MGRFYQTAEPKFVSGTMYEAPIQLMQGVLGEHERRTDELVAKADLLEGAADQVQHLNFEAENQRVTALQDKYNNAVTSITDKIMEDPLNYKEHMPALKSLQKDMLKDKSSGEWYQIERRYNDYANWAAENKKNLEDNPTLYNRLNQYYYNDLVERGTEDPNAMFRGQQGIDKPDLIKGYTKQFENIKASASEESNGMYKIKDKWVSEDEVANIAWNTLISDKNYAGYANQMGNILGDSGYVGEDGNPMNAFNLVDGTGKVITFEEYQALGDEDKKGVSRQLNPRHAFYSDLAAVSQTYSFTDKSISEDAYGKMKVQGQITSGHIAQRQKGAMQLEDFRQQGRSDLMFQKYALEGEQAQFEFKANLAKLASEGDEEAKKTLENLNAKETIGALGNPNANINDDFNTLNNNRENPNYDPNNPSSQIFAKPGTKEYAAQQRWNNSTTYAKNQNGSKVIKLNDGTTFEAKEYFDWLGDERHTEQTAKAFLENKKGIIVPEGGDKSFAQDVVNNARWTPSWLKADEAADWDKIYEAGNAYEESRDTWYNDYSGSTSQVSLQPVNNTEMSNSMYTEMRNNPQNFYMTDAQGNRVDNYTEGIANLDSNNPLYVTAANAHNEMGMKTNIDGADYYIFPTEGDAATTNLMTNLSMRGVDPNSQYFLEMSSRTSNNLLQELNSTGENSAGTKAIVTKVNGNLLSLELIGDQVNVRSADSNLNADPDATFDNMQHFVNSIYSIDK